jgi:isoquinoline 1-oxidoreductase beta subunit
MKRRTVLWLGLGAVGALAVGWATLPSRQRLMGGADRLDDSTGFTPNAWVRIGRDDTITLFMPRAEMGQGTHTGLAMLLAEELTCPLEDIRIAPAPIASVYNNLAVVEDGLPFRADDPSALRSASEHFSLKMAREFGFMMTGGSTSIPDLWVVLREAGALARESLRQAAARHWNVPLIECTARAAQIVHTSGEVLSYGEVVGRAAEHLGSVDEVTLKPAERWSLIGTKARRLEARDKVTGKTQFAADVQEPDMLFAELGFSPFMDGELAAFNENAARALPGVVEVLKLHSIGGAAPAIAVLATQRWQAERALEALDAQWVAGPAGPFEQASLDKALAQALRDDAEVHVHRELGDPELVIASSATVIRADYEVPFLAHAGMEPLCCAAKLEGERATVWAGVQIPDAARKLAAEMFGLEAEQVTLVPLMLGGGFGRRLEADFVGIAAALARAAPGRLVQVLWRREDDTRHDFYRPAARARCAAVLELGIGAIAALTQQSASQSVMAQALPRQLGLPAAGPDRTNVDGAFDSVYEFEHHRVAHTTVELPVPVGFWRSVGHSQQAFFIESFMDELAQVGRIDPVEFRLRHLQNQPRHRAVLQLAADKAEWSKRPGATADGRPIGRGVALHQSFGSIVALVAEVSQTQDNRIQIHRVTVAIDCGVAVNPNLIAQQMESAVVFGLSAALYGRITYREGRVEQGNFDTYPVLRLAECPQIDTWIVASREPPGGVGEPGVPPVAPAVASALASLTGQRYRRLPLLGA